jgi:drug/metabolite transporter (DMT)-like permease
MASSRAQREFRIGVALATGGACAAGAFIVPWKLATAHGRESLMVVLMLGIAAVLSTASMVVSGPRRPSPRFDRATWCAAAALAVLTFTGNLASASAVTRISGPLLSVFLRTEVVLVAVAGWVALGERVERMFIVGTALAGLGVWMINQPAVGGKPDSALGPLLALGAAASFGGMVVVTRKYITRVEPVVLNTLRLWLAFALACAVGGHELSLSEVTPPLLLYTALAAAVGPLLSRLLTMESSRYLESRMTACVNLTAPVWALLFCWLLIDDIPTRHEWAGGSVMLVGVSLPVLLRLKKLGAAQVPSP